MNIKNVKKARKWVEQTPAEEFYMGNWMDKNDVDFTGWVPEGIRKLDSFSAINVFEEHGDLPCGTSACLAGTIHFYGAKNRAEREQWTGTFARDFLGISSCEADRLFMGDLIEGHSNEEEKRRCLKCLDYMIKHDALPHYYDSYTEEYAEFSDCSPLDRRRFF